MKNDVVDSRCGLHCTGCAYKETHGCGGCIEKEGHPFHGECPVAVCCQEKGFVHCGQCPDLPCALLTQYTCDPVHGDTPPGERIRVCRRWAAQLAPLSAGFSGINIYTEDPEASFEFYRSLGFPVLKEGSGDWFGAALRLGEGADAPVVWIWRNKTSLESKNHLVFHCGDIDRTYERLKARGCAIEPPQTQFYGGREMTLTDPDGNVLLFLS